MRLATAQDAWLDRLQVLPAEVPAVPSRQASSPGQICGRHPGFDRRAYLIPRGRWIAPRTGAARMPPLLEALRGSPLISAVEHEHFDDSQQGLLRFEVTLACGARSRLIAGGRIVTQVGPDCQTETILQQVTKETGTMNLKASDEPFIPRCTGC